MADVGEEPVGVQRNVGARPEARRRRAAADDMVASFRLEGIAFTQAELDLIEQYADGRLALDALRRAMKALGSN